MKIKNKIVKFHRIFGLFLSVIMFVWFVSGFVMLYSGFPGFNGKERVSTLKKIDSDDFTRILPFLEKFSENAEEIKLYKVVGKVVAQIRYKNKEQKRYFLHSGKEIKNIDETLAFEIAATSFNLENKKYDLEIINKLDTWIPWEKMEKHFPIYKFYFEDEDKNEIYISSVTGEVLQQSTSSDRFWAYLGAIPHWLYFKDLRKHLESWRWVIIILSGAGSLMCVLGIFAGFARLKKKRKNKIDLSPYKLKLYKWHHYSGFIFGFITFTWVLSGMFSLVPAGWFYTDKEENKILTKWENSFGTIKTVNWNNICEHLETSDKIFKTIIIKNFAGENYTVFKNTNFNSMALITKKLHKRADESLQQNMKSYLETIYGNQISKIEILQEYDNYYYARKMKRALPVVKVEFSNRVRTIYYIDPLQKKLVKINNKFSRVRRWLYKGLHSLDFSFIYYSKIWEPLILILMAGGTLLSFTGVIFLYSKIKRKFK